MRRFFSWSFVLIAFLALGGCTLGEAIPGYTAPGRAVKTALTQGIVIFNDAHFKAASAVEELRCKRPVELVLKMADERGEGWFNAYVQSCPQIRSLIARIAGAAAVNQGFRLVPLNTPD